MISEDPTLVLRSYLMALPFTFEDKPGGKLIPRTDRRYRESPHQGDLVRIVEFGQMGVVRFECNGNYERPDFKIPWDYIGIAHFKIGENKSMEDVFRFLSKLDGKSIPMAPGRCILEWYSLSQLIQYGKPNLKVI